MMAGQHFVEDTKQFKLLEWKATSYIREFNITHTNQKILGEQLGITISADILYFQVTNNVSHTDSSPPLIGQLPFPDKSCTNKKNSQADKMFPRNHINIQKRRENRRGLPKIC